MTDIPPFSRWLKQVIPVGGAVLDVGCGDRWYWPHVNAKFIGVDAWASFAPDYLLNLEHDDLPNVTVDAVLMADFLEHVSKERGLVLLEQAKRIAPLVLVLTPMQWDDNAKPYHDASGNYYLNPYVFHQSLWGPADFPGFRQFKGVCPGYYHGLWRQ